VAEERPTCLVLSLLRPLARQSVLVTAGTIKRRLMEAWKADPGKPAEQNKGPEIDEEVVVLRACRSVSGTPAPTPREVITALNAHGHACPVRVL